MRRLQILSGQQADVGIDGRGVRDITVFNGLLKIH